MLLCMHLFSTESQKDISWYDLHRIDRQPSGSQQMVWSEIISNWSLPERYQWPWKQIMSSDHLIRIILSWDTSYVNPNHASDSGSNSALVNCLLRARKCLTMGIYTLLAVSTCHLFVLLYLFLLTGCYSWKDSFELYTSTLNKDKDIQQGIQVPPLWW